MKTILFDFDGVIIDSEYVIRAAFTLSYREFIGSGEPPVDEYLRNMGDSFPNIMRKMNLPIEMHEHFCSYSRRLINLVPLHAHVREVLDYFQSRGFKMGIVTGKDRMRTLEMLERHEIGHYFGTVVAGDDVSNPKPHAEPILKALAELGAKPDDAIMLGDADNDIMAARNAKVRSCAALWGVSSEEELRSVNPDYMVHDMLSFQQLMMNQLQPVTASRD
ncbi:phosphoglycolate phosphatase/AHBA synthesis associated protein [Paenibacillus cellulosilyticus]|uniref:Phosphoglycolate phosphatase/AHBA synthesis associated protein n=1 Tax=Paenibacillus cellulosilyticus TaxID=375489 RepID=A0A2V2YTT8_9BACL|nr:HAD-IA family hydrolase [Paenibacillus cellulosilyticus]PWW02854.1 phosphoglycolate phosphatase/AHBA synthesis associated protein [Paenibacillus cellulosilyticus]QKS45770.1 HAD-IA family hydrolase [Paenibacillus cellulosilyticus]